MNERNQRVLVGQRHEGRPIQIGPDEYANALDVRGAEPRPRAAQQKLHLRSNFFRCEVSSFPPRRPPAPRFDAADLSNVSYRRPKRVPSLNLRPSGRTATRILRRDALRQPRPSAGYLAIGLARLMRLSFDWNTLGFSPAR